MRVPVIALPLGLLLSLVAAQGCLASLYEYTDSRGAKSFTDDPAKIPAKSRKKASADKEATAQKETPWLSASQYQAAFNRMLDNRYYTSYTEGRLLNGNIQYRGTFEPFYKDLDKFYSFFGMTDERYAERKASLEAAGFKELYHNHFLDQVGVRLHQACWVKSRAQHERD